MKEIPGFWVLLYDINKDELYQAHITDEHAERVHAFEKSNPLFRPYEMQREVFDRYPVRVQFQIAAYPP